MGGAQVAVHEIAEIERAAARDVAGAGGLHRRGNFVSNSKFKNTCAATAGLECIEQKLFSKRAK
jgi:hypothetical protein